MKRVSPARAKDSKASARRAVIDVGTNSVKLLVADVVEGEIHAVVEDSKQTRLGKGFYETQVLQRSAVEQTAAAVSEFVEEARKLETVSVRVFATSAARDAKNSDELVSAIKKASGLKLEIISGEREAEWVFQGVITNPDLARHPLLILDVGGGSTEFIFGERKRAQFQQSFNIGTVRLLEHLPHSDPPRIQQLDNCRAWLQHFLGEVVAPKLKPLLKAGVKREIQIVGTGGTSTILARIDRQIDSYDREIIEATRLSQEQVRAMVERLWNLSLEERQKIVGLPKKRADVILYGAAIYEAVMDVFEFGEIRVSTRGLRYAALKAD
jgi:exopolyphosphatase / guanosine-5'-triphosphate,3'-diphosphate pyrophosphatase